MKDSYSFHCPSGQLLSWTKIIWNVSIPPSKSMVVLEKFTAQATH
jgi:hypothetical protein